MRAQACYQIQLDDGPKPLAQDTEELVPDNRHHDGVRFLISIAAPRPKLLSRSLSEQPQPFSFPTFLLAFSAMSTDSLVRQWDSSDTGPGGTGDRFARAVIIVAGVAALVASLITFVLVVSLPSSIDHH